MEIIKKKILLEDYISRDDATWGIPKWDLDPNFNAFSVNVFFTQDTDDMGIPTDLPFVEYDGLSVDYEPLLTKLAINGLTFSFVNGNTNPLIGNSPLLPDVRFDNKPKEDYFLNGNNILAYTSDRTNIVESYDNQNKYKPGFNMSENTVEDYEGNTFTSVDKVITNSNLNPITYVESGDDVENINVNNPQPNRGIVFKTYTGQTRNTSIPNGGPTIPLTEIYYKGQGFNDSNTTLSAYTKEEYLFGITTTPTVSSDVFIDRGRATVMQSHLQLSEIRNMNDLVNYGNGYYKIQK